MKRAHRSGNYGYGRGRGRRRVVRGRFFGFLALVAAVIVVIILVVLNMAPAGDSPNPEEPQQAEASAQQGAFGEETVFEADPNEQAQQGDFDNADGTDGQLQQFTPVAQAGNEPTAFGYSQSIMQNGAAIEAYTRAKAVNFDAKADDLEVNGLVTYMGNAMRNNTSLGTANIAKEELGKLYEVRGGSGAAAGGLLLNQPLVITWSEETRSGMDMYFAKKSKQGLAEGISVTDKNQIVFFDVEDGEATREAIDIGAPAAGGGTLDPRGWPLLYLVTEANSETGEGAFMRIYSLISGELLYKEAVAGVEGVQNMSAPIVDGGSDTLFWRGANAVYSCVLNTQYDRAAGSVSVSPKSIDVYSYSAQMEVKADYTGNFSAAGGYLFFADEYGFLQCVDMNTMRAVYMADLGGGESSVPVIEQTAAGTFIYITTTADVGNTAYLRKIDAADGSVLFEQAVLYGGAAGVIAAPVLGEDGLQDVAVFSVPGGGGESGGGFYALNKQNGEAFWSKTEEGGGGAAFVYTPGKEGYVFAVSESGKALLLDGRTGEQRDALALAKGNAMAPVIYQNMALVPAEEGKTYGVKIS